MKEPNNPKARAEADIAQFKTLVADAKVQEVDTPSGRKEVEIAFSNSEQGFTVESGTATGVYRERSSDSLLYHVDFCDDRGRITVSESELVDIEEGEYEY